MRRQARISGGGTLGVRSASALQVWLWLLIFIFQNEFRISRSIQPGYLDFDNLPETNFTCAGKVIGGYYADLEASCQMFHVCTVGQADEPMDIKFLCLNGTVFDQETRVCERVDEVDCTKSEKFYSLNLELYGSTAPPIIQSDQTKPQAQSTEHSMQQTKPKQEESDPSLDDFSTTHRDNSYGQQTEVVDSTEDPMQDIKKNDRKQPPTPPPTHQLLPAIDDEETEYTDEGDEYEEDYHYSPSTTTTVQTTTKTTTTSTTTTRPPQTTTRVPSSTPYHYPLPQRPISSPPPTVSSIPSPSLTSSASPAHPMPSLNPALLTPQEFIYRHRGPGSEAISFQRQSFRPADGVFITHAPPQQQFEQHFQYESSRTAPRPALPRPAPFVQRPQPAPFRPTTNDPRDQLLRPGPTSQPSERHETSIKHRPQQYPLVLPPQRPIPFNTYYYDRKRSDDSHPENESSLSARSVAPPTVTEKPPTKPKSPPRVIVTASASVSDSNGKRLNYTVGNVVSAVKPIVAINYDDYKESDLIFDPFFLDVPKLQKRRKSRSNRRNRKVFTVPATATVSPNLLTRKEVEKTRKISSSSPEVTIITTTSYPSEFLAASTIRATKETVTTTTKTVSTTTASTTTVAWNPDDYVDDNYEPHAYHLPAHPLSVVVAYNYNHSKKQEKPPSGPLRSKELKPKASAGRVEQLLASTSAPVAQTTSSQVEDAVAAHAASPPLSPPPFEAHSCATLRSNDNDCRTRA